MLSICFRMFWCKHSITFDTCLLSCRFHCVDIFYVKFRSCETFTISEYQKYVLCFNQATELDLITGRLKISGLMYFFEPGNMMSSVALDFGVLSLSWKYSFSVSVTDSLSSDGIDIVPLLWNIMSLWIISGSVFETPSYFTFVL